MSYLINPSGRMVAIDDPKQFDELLASPGFARPTEEQETEYIKTKYAQMEQMKATDDGAEGVYFATVSQGGADGYSVAGGSMMRELNKLGVKTPLHYTGQKIAVLFHAPYSLLRIEAPYRIVYTMFESDKIPDDWVDFLQSADKVLVPSNWCHDVFAKANVETQVVPLGYDDTMFSYKERDIKRTKRQTFTFLHYNAFNIRKGFPEVFKAFNKAFKKDEPVKMIFKTTLENIPLPIHKSEYPNIEIIKGKTSHQELLDICARSDCFVFPSRGEGFGMTPLEAMATGLPAIVPNAHGITEYFNKDYMYEVKVKNECPALYSRYKDQDVGKMVVCDVDDLARQMRYVYEHQEEAYEMGKKASEYVKQWTITKTAEKLNAVFEDVLSRPITERPLRNVLSLEKIT